MIYFVLFVFFARQIAPRSIARASRVAGTASQPGCFSEMHRGRVEPFMSPEDLGERLCSDSLGRSQRGSGQCSEKKGSRRVLARHNEGCDGLCLAQGSCLVFLPAALFSRGQNDGAWPLSPPPPCPGVAPLHLFLLSQLDPDPSPAPSHTLLLPIPTLCHCTSLHQGQFVTIILRFAPINTMRCPHRAQSHRLTRSGGGRMYSVWVCGWICCSPWCVG